MPKALNNKSYNSNNNNEQLRKLIESAMKKKFANQIAFASYLGITQATVSRYLSGNTVPSLSTLQKMSLALGIDLGLINNNYTPNITNDIFKIPFYYSEHSAGKGIITPPTIHNNIQHLSLDKMWFKDEFNLDTLDNTIFAFKALTDSMAPIIEENDLVIAKVQSTPSNYHGIFLINYNDEYLIKKLQFKNRYLIKLISNNLQYDALEVNLQQQENNFKIIAKIIGRINTKKFTNLV